MKYKITEKVIKKKIVKNRKKWSTKVKKNRKNCK